MRVIFVVFAIFAPLAVTPVLLSCGDSPPLSTAPAPVAPAQESPGLGPDAAAAVPPDAAPVMEPAPAPICPARDDCGPRVEEWGTYTSVQASDGHTLGGVHHEDEALPPWVHRRDWGPDAYFLETLPEEPLQQLETPVLYFWSPAAGEVQVSVDFPRGVVGQWYPEAESFVPALRQMTALARGSMTWKVTLDPALTPASFAPVSDDEIWAPSRRVASTPLRWTSPMGAEEREQFIFYRGLGTFDAPIRIVSAPDGRLHIINPSKERAPMAFILQVSGDRARIAALGSLEPGVALVVSIPPAEDGIDQYLAAAHALLESALTDSGLHADVARAMVDTWSRSWFRNPGLRVLYLAPRAWTDAWLPTTITPAPSAFVRTLVGRIEILTPGEESALVATIQARRRAGTSFDVATLGRFAEPRLLRAVELLKDPMDVLFGQQLLNDAHHRR